MSNYSFIFKCNDGCFYYSPSIIQIVNHRLDCEIFAETPMYKGYKKLSEEKVIFKGGASSSKIPRFDLIPRQALVRLAKRYELGIEKHGENAWNIGNENQAPLDDKEWIIARLAHVIDHATKAIDKIRGHAPIDEDDDAAAIMWGGSVLVAATERWAKQKNE